MKKVEPAHHCVSCGKEAALRQSAAGADFQLTN
jgi:predicted nucleic acid-binding Zn ribbon protein